MAFQAHAIAGKISGAQIGIKRLEIGEPTFFAHQSSDMRIAAYRRHEIMPTVAARFGQSSPPPAPSEKAFSTERTTTLELSPKATHMFAGSFDLYRMTLSATFQFFDANEFDSVPPHFGIYRSVKPVQSS